MSLYLEVPAEVNKAEQLIGLLNADIMAGELEWPPPGMRIYVCVIRHRTATQNSGPRGVVSESAQVISDYREFQRANYAGDPDYKTWLSVPMGRVLEQHPSLDILQASPQTMTKVKA